MLAGDQSRERLLRLGAGALSDAELVALVAGIDTPQALYAGRRSWLAKPRGPACLRSGRSQSRADRIPQAPAHPGCPQDASAFVRRLQTALPQ